MYGPLTNGFAVLCYCDSGCEVRTEISIPCKYLLNKAGVTDSIEHPCEPRVVDQHDGGCAAHQLAKLRAPETIEFNPLRNVTGKPLSEAPNSDFSSAFGLR